MTYVDLNEIHTPATGSIVPTAWGLQIDQNFRWLAERPSAKLSGSTTSLPNGTATGLEWSDPDWDTHNSFRQSQAADRLTAPFDGVYRFEFYLTLNYVAASGLLVVSIYGGDEEAGVLKARGQDRANSASLLAATCVWEAPLERGEWAQARAYQTTGIDLFPNDSSFTMEWVARL